MKIERKETEHITSLIALERTNFVVEKFLEMADLKFKAMYKALKANNFDFVKNLCTEDYAKFLKNHANDVLIINSDIDFITIQFKKLSDYRKNDNYEEIDVDMHVYYIDYMNNNEINFHPKNKKYLEHVYRVTFCVPSYQMTSDNDYKCDCCGAAMKKHPGRNMYSCDYCGYIKVLNYNEWKISNVEKIG